MVIHVVTSGDTVFNLSQQYQVPMSQIILDNDLDKQATLVVGQALVIQFPQTVYTVVSGDTLSSVARLYGTSVRELWRNNPILQGDHKLYSGQTLVITYYGEKLGTLSTNGYAYPFINNNFLQSQIPYLTDITPFTYGMTPSGGLVDLNDATMIALTKEGGANPLMHLSSLNEAGAFSNELAHQILTNSAAQDALIQSILTTFMTKGYGGLDVDFEYVYPQDGPAYTAFLERLSNTFNPLGYPVLAALAPKVSAQQKGLLYEAHNYQTIGKAVNDVLLMTYEWGYKYGPPMAVAPLPKVREVVEYALTEIPPQKIWLGIPNYGYDWPLPFNQGETSATSISSQQAIALAITYKVPIQYDTSAQAPWFNYQDEFGTDHIVWFEDARSIRAKLALTGEYGLSAVGYWNLMRDFPQNWRVLHALYHINDPRPFFP